ncbi:MAG: carbohydrate kinase [Bacteroidales bacterium]|mgnify:FL=1|nr:carbohydrate kinase [Bacteroidales bacterium]
MKRIVGFGEALWDVFPEGRKIGGAPANFAYHVAQWGLDSCAVSAIGNDELGDDIVRKFDENGLNYRLERVDFPTGTVQVTLDENKVPSYNIMEGVAWDNIPMTPELEALARDCRAVCFGSLAQRSAVSRATINAFIDMMPEDSLKIFDINLRQHYYTEEIICDSMKKADILKINDEEILVVAQLLDVTEKSEREICKVLLDKFDLRMVILTCGDRGSYVLTRDESSWVDTPKVSVVSTVGAGDSFTGTFIASILLGKTLRQAHEAAVKVSAYVCTCQGAMPAIPKDLLV